ncbi:MAG: aldo/keto reductase [Bacteroidota bacterium]|nr:aldo/keto reductase [Bacteroidota bacterium]
MVNKRPLGNSGIEVAPLALGGNVFGWTIDEKKSFTILDGFMAAGYNLIDTADVYSRWAPGNKGGESETIIGHWMKDRHNRDKVIVATKVGGDMGQGKKDLSARHILKAVENSLIRLQTDYIDLYQSHYDDPATPVDETLEAYAKLVKDGKVRIIGASNFTPERLLQSLEAATRLGYPLYHTLQPLYNLYDREVFERELEPICIEHSIGVISYYSLASGFLTGKYRSEKDLAKSPRGGGNKKYLNDRGFRILDALDTVAAQLGSTAASVSISWLQTRPSVIAPIASATSTEQLEWLIKAAELKLDANSIGLLNNASEW